MEIDKEKYAKNILEKMTEKEHEKYFKKINKKMTGIQFRIGFMTKYLADYDFTDGANKIIEIIDLCEKHNNSRGIDSLYFRAFEIYKKAGNTERAEEFKNLIMKKHPESIYKNWLE